MSERTYAHSLRGRPVCEWQTLSDHSDGVALLAQRFAAAFGSEASGALAGAVHDIGKARDVFQAYLARCNGIEDAIKVAGEHSHSGTGACWLWQNAGSLGKAIAYCVAGHHAGLPDYSGGEAPCGALVTRIADEKNTLDEKSVRGWLQKYETKWLAAKPKPPFLFSGDDSSLSFWIRMMFSCLVDADFLDTEKFMDSVRCKSRPVFQSLESLAERFFAMLDGKQRSSTDTPVNRIRAQIRSACEMAAENGPGLFSLTVPTGGGKTLSGTAFAFKHALRYGFKRIIYVIPYTSIIEQTADVLRDFIGNENVIEHHSNLDPEKETDESRLAAENWDAPVVVTTAVQFFESLYACRPGRCRKLHNIAESVVVLDEVQLLPTRLLLPCAEAVRQLATHYRASVILSTATQLNLPGVDLSSVREIVPATLDLYSRLKRTEIEFPPELGKRKTWEEVAGELAAYDQVLCIVNTRRDCFELYSRMPEGTIHLSAGMCGEHRSRVIAGIKSRLAEGLSVRVVSTQLIEAGVDVDFPVVYRAFSGLSSVAQSAGRCNREGRLAGCGRVVVFMPPNETKVKDLRDGEYAMGDLLRRPGGVDVDCPESYPDYFKALHIRAIDMGTRFEYMLGVPVPKEFRNPASHRPDPMHYQFREAAAEFKMIDGYSQVPVIVRYGDSDDYISALRAAGPKRNIMRKLQRYVVNVPRGCIMGLLEKGIVEELHFPSQRDGYSGIYIQTLPSAYLDDIGLNLFGDGLRPEDFMI